MTKFLSRCLVFLAALTTSVAAMAESPKSEDIYKYLELSGATKALDGVPDQMASMANQMQLTAKDPAEAEKIMEILVSSWRNGDITGKVVKHIQQNVDADTLAKFINFNESDLATRVKAEETKASDADFQQQLMRFMADIQSAPPAPERAAGVRSFVESTKMVDHTMDMVMQMMDAMVSAFAAADKENGEMMKAQIQGQMGQMRTMMEPAMEQQMMMTSFYIYEKISDADLAEYTKHYQSDLGQEELKVVYGAMGSAMESWATSLAGELAAELNQKS